MTVDAAFRERKEQLSSSKQAPRCCYLFWGGYESTYKNFNKKDSREVKSMESLDDYLSDDKSANIETTGSGDDRPIQKSQENAMRTETDANIGDLPVVTKMLQPSLTQIVQRWGNFIDEQNEENFGSLDMNLCGPAQLTASNVTSDIDKKLFEPIVLRHTHSTPVYRAPSILDEDDEDIPPPVGLETLKRSRSTPLSTSINSAFGTTLKTVPCMNCHDDERSAFTLPPYRLRSPKSLNLETTSDTTFNPIQDTEMDAEYVSIEVMDLPSTSRSPVVKNKQGTSRIARFLSEMRSFGSWRRRSRGGRENPARPPSSSDESRKKGNALDEYASSSDSLPIKLSSELPVKLEDSSHGRKYKMESNTVVEDSVLHRQDRTKLHDNQETGAGRVRIQVSTTVKEPPQRIARSSAVTSPLQIGRNVNAQTSSHDSPGRSMGSSIGHTTLRTSTTISSGQMSHLSSISETDIEVMELNKRGARNEMSSLASKGDQLLHSIPLSSVRDARYAGYTSLGESPSLRDGANVPADRFFKFAESGRKGLSRQSPSLRSPTTVSSSSANTSSTSSTLPDELPPVFVSYLDRKTVSDLTSRLETSSPRAGEEGNEVRESSPSDTMVSSGSFRETFSQKAVISKKPRPMRPTRGFQDGKRVRSLPPRSPMKGLRASNTPPLNSGVSTSPEGMGSASPSDAHFQSVLDEGIEQGEQEVVRMTSYYKIVSRTHSHDDHSIEVLKTDSKDDLNSQSSSQGTGAGRESS
jgi:hypothetical protein